MSPGEQSVAPTEPAPGAQLRQARERAGLTLNEVAKRTMIPLNRLQALEGEDYARVGAPTFVVGYVRTYAKAVGIDPAPLVQCLEHLLPKSVATEKPPVALALEVQHRPKSVFWPVMLVVVGALGFVAYLGLSGADPASDKATDMLATHPANHLLPMTTADESPAASLPSADVESVAAPAPITPEAAAGNSVAVEQQHAPPSGAAQVDDQNIAADGEAATPPAQSVRESALPAAVAEPASAASPAELTLDFRGECWVSVTDATGKRIVARLASSGDNLRLFGQPPLDVILGNAAVVELTLNGRPVDTTPPPGRRNLRLTLGERAN